MKKVLMIGLDGATFSLLKPLIQEGYMPYLGQILENGYHADLMSTPVPLTPPGWISTVTGVKPETHGIYDFLRPEVTGNGVFLKVNDSRDIQSNTVWTLASRQGKRVTSMNFYGMSPPVEIDGNLISGFIPWKHLRSATTPESLFDEVKNSDEIDIKKLGMDIGEEKKCIQGLPETEYEEWIEMQSVRDKNWTCLMKKLMTDDPTDLTAIVYDGTDKIQHLFWRFLDPELASQTITNDWEKQIREKCLEYYTQIDNSIKELVEKSGEGTNLVITSDHGFGPTDEVVYINEWLHREGYLQWAEDTVKENNTKLTADRIKDHSSMIDWENTKAYAVTPSSNAIYISRKTEKNPNGVSDEEYVEFCTKLKERLLAYRCANKNGQVFVKADLNERRIEGREDLNYAPDITLGLRDGGFVSILRSEDVVREREVIDGTHRPNGIFIGSGPMFKKGEGKNLSIYDITPILLYGLGL
jgi:predicted AlkP superfamily phosphohydrolase/phosphomutase